MLDRYKKTQGFLQLLQLIEGSSETKKEHFLSLVRAESAAWESLLRKKALTAQRIWTWPNECLREILTRLQPLTLATLVHQMEASERARHLIFFQPSEQRKIMQLLEEITPGLNEITLAQGKLISEARNLIQVGVIKIEKIDPDLGIPSNIEEQLENEDPAPQLKSESSQREKTPRQNLQHEDPSSTDTLDAKQLLILKKENSELHIEIKKIKQENSLLKDKLERIKKIA